MKSPLGFGKKYFTFTSILAHSVSATLQSRETSYALYLNSKIPKDNDEIDESPPEEINEILFELDTRPCCCNFFFKLKTKIALLIHHYIPRCPYYTTYFAFRRTGVHPPL